MTLYLPDTSRLLRCARSCKGPFQIEAGSFDRLGVCQVVGLAYVVLLSRPLLLCQGCDQPTSGLLHQRLSQRAAVPVGRVNASVQVGRASGAFGGIGRR